jgi:hypothetical protein
MKLLKTILSIALALFTIAYSGGLAVYSHFCKGEVVEVSLMAPPEGCEMLKVEHKVCHTSDIDLCETGNHVKKPGCCEDVSLMLVLEDFQSSEKVSKSQVDFFGFGLIDFSSSTRAFAFRFSNPPAHGPPDEVLPSGWDIRVRNQSFLC